METRSKILLHAKLRPTAAQGKEDIMKLAADFRQNARDALRGHWPVAVLTGFVASLIGAELVGGSSVNNSSWRNQAPKLDLNGFFQSALWHRLFPWFVVLLCLWVLFTLVVSGAGKLGYARFNLNLVDGREAKLGDLFSQFDRLGVGFCMNVLMVLYTVLWCLLFFIPGIIKSYSYAMTPYVLYEHPELTANQAITESRRLMDGNKWRLFCLGFSFIGWDLLCSLPLIVLLFGIIRNGIPPQNLLLLILLLSIPLGAGYLFLRPYRQASYAAFYRDISVPEVQSLPQSWENNSTEW